MSGFVSSKPIRSSSTYNPDYYSDDYIKSSDTRVSYISGVLPGQAIAKKALIVDSSLNIAGINSISATRINGKTIELSDTVATNLSMIKFTNNISRSFEWGLRGSGAGPNSGTMYLYDNFNSTFKMIVNPSNGLITMNSNLVIGSSGLLSVNNSAAPTFNLDMGSPGLPPAMAISMYAGTRGFGASTSALNSYSDTAHKWWYSASAQLGSSGSAPSGTNTMTLSSGGALSVSSTTDATNSTTGSITTPGGLGIAKALFVGTSINSATAAFSSNTDSTSTTTGSITTAGGVGIAKKLYVGSSVVINGTNVSGALSITSLGTAISIFNDPSNFTGISTAGNGNFTISPQTSGPVSTTYTFSPSGQVQLSGLTPRNSHKLDLGQLTTQSNILCLAQLNNISPSYMIGVNSSELQYTSGESHAWYSNTSTTPAVLGTKEMLLNGAGNLITLNAGQHAYGFDSTGLSAFGGGAHMHYGSSIAQFFGYNYATGTGVDCSLGHNQDLYIESSNGFVGIGTTVPTCPLTVANTGVQTWPGPFGFLAVSGASTSTGFVNRLFSIRSSGGIYVATGEIDVASDLRVKKDVIDITTDLSERFVRTIDPIQFKYKGSEQKHYGYGAQSLIKAGMDVMVGFTQADEPLEPETIECDDGSSVEVRSDTRLIVNMLSSVPLLHKALKTALERIDALTQVVGQQQQQIEQLLE